MRYISSLTITSVVKIEITSSNGLRRSMDSPPAITKLKLVLDDGSYMEVVAFGAEGKAIAVHHE